MRRDNWAGFPQRDSTVAPGSGNFTGLLPPLRGFANNHNRSDIGRFFVELRRVLNTSPFQIAALLQTRAEVLAALEVGDVEALPDLQETARIVLTYAALARIDGEPVLSAIAEELRNMPPPDYPALPPDSVAPPDRPAAPGTFPAGGARRELQRMPRRPIGQFRQTGEAVVDAARRAPKQAVRGVRQRPDRAFYAATLPLGLLWLAMSSSSISAMQPLRHAAVAVADFVSVNFAPVREGLHWIEVNDPRKRRSDKLAEQVAGR